MKTLGIDLDTRALHLVLVDDDTGRAEYLPVPFVGHKPPFRFTDARAVRPRLNEVVAASSQDGWDSIWLVGVERPYAQGRGTAYTYGLLTGAILAAIPSRVCVLELPPNEWYELTVGKPIPRTRAERKASGKFWALKQLRGKPGTLPIPDDFARALADWPQDAFDAYCIARAAVALNAKAVAA